MREIFSHADGCTMSAKKDGLANSHLEYVAGVLEDIAAMREELKGLRMTYAPKVLRHFTARFAEIEAEVAVAV